MGQRCLNNAKLFSMHDMFETLMSLFGSELHALDGVFKSGLRIVLILIVAWWTIAVVQRAIRTLRIRIATRFGDREAVQRAETLGRVFRYMAAVAISLVAGMLILSEVGISVAPILGAAGVAGLAVGFGAQALVKDYFTGFFLLLENQIRQGDVVQLGDHAGSVEEVTLRYVRLRDYDGRVHFVPNGTITSVINMSRGFAYAVMDVSVAYHESLANVMKVMMDTAAQMRADPVFLDRILEDFDMAGVERWGDSAVVIRGRFKVAPLQQWDVRRAYLLKLKARFDAENIEIPFPQLSIHAGRGLDTSRPVLK